MRTVVLTGGGRGLGRGTAEKLAARGHRVVLVARTPDRAAAAAAGIRAAVDGAVVEPRAVDLASMGAVRRFADALRADLDRIDVLLHVAGVLQTSPTRRVTVDGYEETLAVNALAPFLLTRRLLPLLETSAPARIVLVSSRLHLPGTRGAEVDFDFGDPQLERGYDPARAYKNSKLAVLWLTYELQRRLPQGLTANAVCPGFVPTTAAASTTGVQHWLLAHVLPHLPFATSVGAATDALVRMAVDDAPAGVGGRFFADGRAVESSPESYDVEKARRFWDLAARLTEADGPPPG